MKLPEFVTVVVYARTEVPGSKCYSEVNVERDLWESWPEAAKQNFVERHALRRMLKIEYRTK